MWRGQDEETENAGDLPPEMVPLTELESRAFWLQELAALSAGADGFVCKTEPPEKLLAVLRVCLEAVGMSQPMA